MSKPKFSIPAMSEIRSLTPNGLTVVSTFSGAGLSCLGWRMAGYSVLYASEFVPAASEVYRMNSDAYVDERDIRDVKGDEILAQIGLSVGELDVLEGSPPCAVFSRNGNRDKDFGKVKKYSDTKQRVDDLFFEYSRLVGEMRPKVFVAENVEGLIVGKAIGYFRMITAALKEQGYRVKTKLLDSSRLDVPQKRRRVFIIGIREDLELEPEFPTPLPYIYTVADVLPHVKYHGTAPPHKVWSANRRNVRSTLVDSRLNPSPTVIQTLVEKGLGMIETVDGELRRMTIDELKIISTVPHDFELSGSFAQQWERIGRGVPPMMTYHIAKTIKERIFSNVS